jgi:hypothetical protein
MLLMTVPNVTELPLLLEPSTADGFAVVVPRDAPSADLPPSRRRIVD